MKPDIIKQKTDTSIELCLYDKLQTPFFVVDYLLQSHVSQENKENVLE